VEGEVVKIDKNQGRVTIRAADGTIHEFQASKETLQDLKVGDRTEARLRR
jgi:ribosomal protein S1